MGKPMNLIDTLAKHARLAPRNILIGSALVTMRAVQQADLVSRQERKTFKIPNLHTPIAFERQDAFFSKATQLPADRLERETQEIRNLCTRQRKLERCLQPPGRNRIDGATDHQ